MATISVFAFLCFKKSFLTIAQYFNYFMALSWKLNTITITMQYFYFLIIIMIMSG